MKKLISLIFSFCMIFICASQAFSEESFAVEDYYSGVWLNENNYIEILKEDDEFFVSINKWREDGVKSTKWEYICRLENDGSLVSFKGSRFDYVYSGREIIYVSEAYDNGFAVFTQKNGCLYWDDLTEHEGEGVEFEWAPSIPDEYLPPTDAYIDDVYDFSDAFSEEDLKEGDFRVLDRIGCKIWIPRGWFTEVDISDFSDNTLLAFAYQLDPHYLLTVEYGDTIMDYNQFARHLYRKEKAGYIYISSLIFTNGFPAALYYYDEEDGSTTAIMEYFIKDHQYVKFTMHGYEDLDYTCYGFQIIFSLQKADD